MFHKIKKVSCCIRCPGFVAPPGEFEYYCAFGDFRFMQHLDSSAVHKDCPLRKAPLLITLNLKDPR